MLHERDRTNHLLYRFDHIPDASLRRRIFERFMVTARLEHPHILSVQNVGYDDTGRLCVVTTYPGNQDGLVTLGDLKAQRGGVLEFSEVQRLIEQLLETSQHAYERGIAHGPFREEELLIDRHGCTLVELFGLEHALHPSHSDQGAIAEQVRSIAELALTMLGCVPDERVSARTVALPRKSERAWELWFAHALDPLRGFDTPELAISALPGRGVAPTRIAEPKPAPSGSRQGRVLQRFRAVGTGRARRRDGRAD